MGLTNYTRELNGLSLSALGTDTKRMNGVSIGLVNTAEELNGVQIGLVNYAGNNPPGLRWLPFINVNLSFLETHK